MAPALCRERVRPPMGETLLSMLTFTVVEALSREYLQRGDCRANAQNQKADRTEQAIMRA